MPLRLASSSLRFISLVRLITEQHLYHDFENLEAEAKDGFVDELGI